MRDCLIIGAGSTVKHYQEQIENFIKKIDPITIGINNVPKHFWLDYHLWMNSKRYQKYSSSIKDGARLLVPKKMYEEQRPGLYVPGIEYRTIIKISDNMEKWRTGGIRAIQYAHDKGAKNIYCVGFDGYSLVYKGDQHCYGSGLTDLADMKKQKDMKNEVEKDELIYTQMKRMRMEGVEFSVLTPTIYEWFYVGGL